MIVRNVAVILFIAATQVRFFNEATNYCDAGVGHLCD